jgi:predicted RNA methylase
MAFLCLKDKERTLALMDIVADTVERYGLAGSCALDAGAGCGPLSFAFLNAGGGNVNAIELLPHLCLLMGRIAERLGFSRQITIKNEDVLEPGPGIDPGTQLVMCEMVGTGLITEHIVPAIRTHLP